jgi:hypothetical protein
VASIARCLDDLVLGGLVRSGVTGYWLPEQPDPGALLVMRRAMAR